MDMGFTKVVRLGTTELSARNFASVYARIVWDGNKLSITGVEGPGAGGSARGSCGQIVMNPPRIFNLAPKWTHGMVARFWREWNTWHLNDMKAGTPAQTELIRLWTTEGWKYTFDEACNRLESIGLLTQDGYKYGSKWLTVKVPADTLEFLRNLPDSDKVPAWV